MDAVPIWVRVGGGMESVPDHRRHGPADIEFPPPGGPWEPLMLSGRLVGWAEQGGLRMARRSVLNDIVLEADSPFIGAELAIKAMLKGYRVGEVGIQTFPREFGSGSSASLPNILATMADMWRIYRKVFSDAYDLPAGRRRN